MDIQNTNNKVHLTAEGLKEIKAEYAVLIDQKRPRLVERLSLARAAGDLSENNDYTSAKEELEFMDGRILELGEILQNVVLIKKKGKTTIDLGAKVTVQQNGERHVFNIVGEWEADPKDKKISHESPLGRALLGKKKGDVVEVEAPVGKITYKILSVE